MEKINVFDQIARNKRNSIFLTILVFIILFGLLYSISLIFYPTAFYSITIISLAMVLVYIWGTYQYGDKIVLKAVDARPADEIKHRYLIDTVEGLAIAAGIPKPKIYIFESEEMNAFATGKTPQNASVAVTSALLKNLNRSELEGVIGHEISHIRNFDIKFATLVAVMVGLIAIVSNIMLRSYWYGVRTSKREKAGILILIAFILAIFAPIVSRLVQAAISRRREFLADAGSAQLTRYPEGLASALEKIGKINKGNMKVSEAISHLFFIDPNKSPLDNIFATHPSITERVKMLRAM